MGILTHVRYRRLSFFDEALALCKDAGTTPANRRNKECHRWDIKSRVEMKI